MDKSKNMQFAVIGLGRFGMSILETLAERDVDLLAVDKDPGLVRDAAEFATQVVQLDAGDEKALEELGLGNYDVVIITMGEDFEASLMTAMLAKEQGARYVLVKARSLRQKKILETIGADRVVQPEHDMGRRVALGLLGDNITEVLDESENHLISEMKPKEEWIGKTIRESDIRGKEDLLILAIRHGKRLLVPVSPDQVIEGGDTLLVLSQRKD